MGEWEIDSIRKLSRSEKIEYYENLITKYKEEIKSLKIFKREKNTNAIKEYAWRLGLISSGIAALSGPLMTLYGQDIVKIAGEVLTISSIGMFTINMIWGMVSDEKLSDIKHGIYAAREADNQIKILKRKIREIKQNPLMIMR